jgi:hypothetical protein
MIRRRSNALRTVVVAVLSVVGVALTPLPGQAAVTRQVTFVLVTSDGRPVVGSHVTWSANDGSASAGAKKRTDSTGRVTFLAVPLTPVSVQAQAAEVGIPKNNEVVGGQVSGAGTLTDFLDASVEIPPSGDVTVNVGDAPVALQQRVVVQMPDGTPVPGAVLQAVSVPSEGHNSAPWLYRHVSGPEGDRATWAACPYDPACFQLTWDTAAGAAQYKITTGSDGGANLWRFDRSQGAPEADCPFVASFNDGELAQNAPFDCVSGGPITVELPYMPAVRVESVPAPVDAGMPAAVTVRAVDGTGAPIAGMPVDLKQLSGRTTSAKSSQCKPRPSGVTQADGRVALVLCPTSTGVWQADGPSLVPSRAIPISVRATSVSALEVVPGNNQVALSWKAPLDNTAGAVKQYKVSVSGGKTCKTTKTSCAFSGLTNGRRYRFKIQAYTALGSLPPVKVRAVAGSPSAPRRVAASASSRGLLVSWTKPVSTGGARITGYRVTVGPKVCRTTSEMSCTVTGLKKGREYEIVVVALNARGVGVASLPVLSPAIKG